MSHLCVHAMLKTQNFSELVYINQLKFCLQFVNHLHKPLPQRESKTKHHPSEYEYK